ncbi:hypothetical protein [Lujinxingia litoralis]|nr:hypothetical protein [Lujinxingia litoralis]
MHLRLAAIAACALVAGATLCPSQTRAQEPPTPGLSQILQRAHCVASTTHDAGFAEDAARGQVAAAERLLSGAPELSLHSGPRFRSNADSNVPELDIGAEIGLELGRPGDRRRRRTLAKAHLHLSREAHRAENAAFVHRALRLYVHAALAQERAIQARERHALNAQLASAARAQSHTGDAGALDAELASLAEERSQAQAAGLEATARAATRKLQSSLQPTEEAELPGVRIPKRTFFRELAEALEQSDGTSLRADLLARHLAELQARAHVTRARRWPGLRISLGAQREGTEALAAHLGLGFAFGSTAQRRAEADALEAAASRARSARKLELERQRSRGQALSLLLRELLHELALVEQDLLPRHRSLRRRYADAYRTGALPLSTLLLHEHEFLATEQARQILLGELLHTSVDALEWLEFSWPQASSPREASCGL